LKNTFKKWVPYPQEDFLFNTLHSLSLIKKYVKNVTTELADSKITGLKLISKGPEKEKCLG
jgi:hypothetical protein